MRLYPTIPTVGTILGVWAHPDDESYLSAGLMALARRQGQRVALVTATAGEAGTVPGGEDLSLTEVAAIRMTELAASLSVLGVTEHAYLGLADGECATVALDEGATLIGELIEAVEPDTIITFGPDGITGHPDHLATSAWTTEAWRRSDRRARLWYATVTPEFHRRWGVMNDGLGIWAPGGPRPCTPERSLAMQVQLHGDLLDQKVRALRAHASQIEPMASMIGEEAFAAWWSEECFVDANRARVASPHPMLEKSVA